MATNTTDDGVLFTSQAQDTLSFVIENSAETAIIGMMIVLVGILVTSGLVLFQCILDCKQYGCCGCCNPKAKDPAVKVSTAGPEAGAGAAAMSAPAPTEPPAPSAIAAPFASDTQDPYAGTKVTYALPDSAPRTKLSYSLK